MASHANLSPFNPSFFLPLSHYQTPISLFYLILLFSIPNMKLTNFIPTKNLFKPKKSRSFSSSNGSSTPTSVLPETPPPGSCFELKLAFQMIDSDGDGKIMTEDLERLLCRIGAGSEAPSREELKLMLSEVDRDGNGCISLEEFQAIGPAFAPPACDGEMKEAFDFFDSDRDGRITAEELFRVFRTIGDVGCTLEDCRRMIRGVDRNGEGFVCFEDFSRMMEVQ